MKGLTWLVTGASGFLGRALIPFILKTYKPKSIRLFSRNDWRMAQLLREHNDLYKYKVLRPLIGDACDRERVMSVFDGVDVAICAHAIKRIEIANFCPQEAIKVNVLSVMNCMDAAIQRKIKKFIFTSTDKAYRAENLYGKTKAASEQMIIERARMLGDGSPKMMVTRYGNCLASTGAVLPYWIELAKAKKPLPLTDPKMTRFLLTRRMALEVITQAVERGKQGELILPKTLYSVNMADAADWINRWFYNKAGIQTIGTFPGEKTHEELADGISSDKYLIKVDQFCDLLHEEGLI